MIDYILDTDEQELLGEVERAIDDNTFVSIDNLSARKKELQQVARSTFNKTRNINIRLSKRDLHRLKKKAVEEGIPYQTLASSILHKATAH